MTFQENINETYDEINKALLTRNKTFLKFVDIFKNHRVHVLSDKTGPAKILGRIFLNIPIGIILLYILYTISSVLLAEIDVGKVHMIINIFFGFLNVFNILVGFVSLVFMLPITDAIVDFCATFYNILKKYEIREK